MKGQEKRKARSYKISDSSYKRALNRGRRDGLPLANLVESVVFEYGNGATIALYMKGESVPAKAIVLS